MSEGDTIPLRGSADMWRSRAKAAEAEVARLTQLLDDLGHRYAGVESSLHGASARIAELEAAGRELIRTQAEAERHATEAALRWAWNEYINSNFVIDPNGFIERGLLDLLVEK